MSLDDLGPALTPAEAAALHNQPGRVAWFAIPAPGGAGVIARAHTEAHDGGWLAAAGALDRQLGEDGPLTASESLLFPTWEHTI